MPATLYSDNDMTQEQENLQSAETQKPSENDRPSENEKRSDAAPPKRRKNRLRGLLLAFSGVALASAGFVGWLAGTESGLRFGLYKIPSWFGVKITSESLHGTLWRGFHGENWLIETDGADVALSRFRFGWRPRELSDLRLHVTELSAGDIRIATKPTPPKEKKPSQGLPESIDLPVWITLDRLETGKISVGKNFKKQTVYLNRVRAAYRYDQKQHRLDIERLESPWSNSAGAVEIGLKPPFALNSAIYTKGELDGETIHGTTRLTGSLRDMQSELLLDGDAVHLKARSLLHPFAGKLNEIIKEVQIKGFNINPHSFLDSLPKAELDFDAIVVPSFSDGIALDGAIDLSNEAAGYADENSIPVRSILGDFTIDGNGLIRVKDTAVELLQQGTVTVNGSVDTAADKLDLALAVKNLGADDAVRQQIAGRLNGSINVKGETGSPEIGWKLDSGYAETDGLLIIRSDRRLGQKTLTLDKLRIRPDNGGELAATGSLELFRHRRLKLDVSSKAFNPARIDRQLPEGNVNGTIAVSGELADQKFGGKMKFAPSTLSGVALSGSADIQYESNYLSRALTDIRLGSNTIKTSGSFGRKGRRLNLDISAPDLSRFGFGLGGAVTAKGYVSGDLSDGLKTLEADLDGRARAFRMADLVQINTLDFKLKGSPDINRPLNAELKGERIVLAGKSPTTVDAVNLFVSGTGANHRIRGGSSMALDDKRYKLEIDAAGGLNKDKTRWKGIIDALDISGAFNLKLQNRMNLEAGADHVSMSAARWSAMGGSLNLQNFVWDKKTGITTKGNAQNLHMAELHNFYTPPVEHNLVLGGDWDMSYSQNARGYLNIVRQSGDIILPDNKQPLGLSALALRTRFQNGRIDAALEGGTRFGKVDATVGISQQFGSNIANAPVSGKVNVSIARLESLRVLLPSTAQSLSGSFNASAVIGGRAGSPTVNGTLNGATNYGRLDGNVTVGQGSDFMNAPLGGRINITVPELEAIRNFLPVGQTVKGRLNAAVTLAGRVNEPQLNGTLNGENLYYRNQAQGLILDNGILRSRLQGQKWIIDSLKFHRGGTVELKGEAALDKSNPDVNVDIVFDKYRTLSRPNRRLVLSGQTKVLYHPEKGLVLTGSLKADSGMFGLQKSSMPTLDDDVTVVGEEQKVQTASTPISMNLDLDLNDNVRFSGEGLNVTLGGTLKLQARPGETIQGVGAVKVVKGRYKAYGQDLDITKGVISFVGPLTDPNLNIRAERRLSPVGAGVEVLGSLNNPRITLVADEVMSEKDKLSWLILNRASSGNDSDNAALSAAAGALLAGQINDRIGLVDDFGFTSKRSRNAQTGELNPAEQVLTVGKQLTSELYLGYEYGMNSAAQSAKLVYQLTRAIQAIVRVGNESSGGELKYTIRFDHWRKQKEPQETVESKGKVQ